MKKENPIFKKWWFWLIAVLAVLTIYGAIEGVNQGKEQIEKEKNNPIENKEEPETKTVENEDNSNQEVEEVDSMIKLDDELLFAELKINMKSVEVYEEDGKDLAEVKYTWTNQSGDGKKYFFALTTHDVLQGDEVLTEITGAADMENKNTNSYHEHNAEGGTVNIKLVYELVDKETPITLRFKPLNEFNEDAQEVTIEIN